MDLRCQMRPPLHKPQTSKTLSAGLHICINCTHALLAASFELFTRTLHICLASLCLVGHLLHTCKPSEATSFSHLAHIQNHHAKADLMLTTCIRAQGANRSMKCCCWSKGRNSNSGAFSRSANANFIGDTTEHFFMVLVASCLLSLQGT